MGCKARLVKLYWSKLTLMILLNEGADTNSWLVYSCFFSIGSCVIGELGTWGDLIFNNEKIIARKVQREKMIKCPHSWHLEVTSSLCGEKEGLLARFKWDDQELCMEMQSLPSLERKQLTFIRSQKDSGHINVTYNYSERSSASFVDIYFSFHHLLELLIPEFSTFILDFQILSIVYSFGHHIEGRMWYI